jgi:hypothetical protein
LSLGFSGADVDVDGLEEDGAVVDAGAFPDSGAVLVFVGVCVNRGG